MGSSKYVSHASVTQRSSEVFHSFHKALWLVITETAVQSFLDCFLAVLKNGAKNHSPVKHQRWIFWGRVINLFYATDLFWYPLKTSENLLFSDVFGRLGGGGRGYQKRAVAWSWLTAVLFQVLMIQNWSRIREWLTSLARCKRIKLQKYIKNNYNRTFLDFVSFLRLWDYERKTLCNSLSYFYITQEE